MSSRSFLLPACVRIVFIFTSRRPGSTEESKVEEQYINHHALTKHIKWLPHGAQVAQLAFNQGCRSRPFLTFPAPGKLRRKLRLLLLHFYSEKSKYNQSEDYLRFP